MRRARSWAIPLAAAAVLGALAFLLLEVSRSPSVARSAAAPAVAPVAPATTHASTAPAPTLAVDPAPAAPDVVEKLDPQSDAFFFKFDEVVPAKLTREAAVCYEGAPRVHRNQKLRLGFKTRIKDGEVSVTDVKVLTSTLNNPELQACFIRKVSGARWHDDELPDWVQDDLLVLRPGRGMKKYSRANLDYEGSGPIGAPVMRPGQPKPWSDSATADSAAMAPDDVE